MDQLSYGQIIRKEALSRTHQWESFSVAGTIWAKVQRYKGGIPIEYMNCDSRAVADGDRVIVEFTDQDWTQPKVIGFADNPRICTGGTFFPDGTASGQPGARLNYVYTEYSDSWSAHGNFTESKIPYGPAVAGMTGLGLYLGGRINKDNWSTGTYYTISYPGAYHYGPFPMTNTGDESIDKHLQHDIAAETWQIAQSSGIEAEDQNYKSLGNGQALAHGGHLHEIYNHGYADGSISGGYHFEWGAPSNAPIAWDDFHFVGQYYWRPNVAPGAPGLPLVDGRYYSNHPGKEIFDDTKIYSVSTNSWVVKQSGPERYSNACFVANDKFYVVGGFEEGIQYANTVSELAYESGPFYVWPLGHSLPHEHYPGDISPGADGKEDNSSMDAMWSRRSARLAPDPPVRGVDSNNQYDSIVDSWNVRQAFPHKIWSARGFSLNGQGFVGGGADYDGWLDLCSDDLQFENWWQPTTPYHTMSSKGYWYDPITNTWSGQICGSSPKMGGFCGGRWGGSELNGKTMGMRVGKRHWPDAATYVLDPIADVWSSRRYAHADQFAPSNPYQVDWDERRDFGDGAAGAEC
jgi:hypothetical protein